MADLRRRLDRLEELTAARWSPLSAAVTQEGPPAGADANAWAMHYQRMLREPLSPALAASYAKAEAEAARHPISRLAAAQTYRVVMGAGASAAFLANLDAEIAQLAVGVGA